jgi:hypothetical protein
MSCAIVGLSRCAYYYQPKLLDDSVIVSVLNAITDRHLRWGAFPNVLIASESLAVISEIMYVCIGYIVN